MDHYLRTSGPFHENPQVRTLTFPWMFGQKIDLLFFFLPVPLGITLFVLSQASAISSSSIWLFLVLDAFGAGPFHFGPTWFAYFDRKNREYWKSMRRTQLIFFLGPPLLILTVTLGHLYADWVIQIPIMIWAIQHLVQQNVGILLLYHNQGKGEAIVNRQLEMKSQQLPAILFSLIFFYRVFLHSPEGIAWTVFFAGVSLWAVHPVAEYIIDMWKQVRAGAYVNVPALAFWIVSVICMVPFAFLGKSFSEGWIIPVTVHWFQYIGLNYALVKNKYASGEPQVGDLPRVAPLLLFLITCAGFLLAWATIWFLGNMVFAATDFVTRLLTGIWLGVICCHYFLDAFLWRFREPFARQTILPYLLRHRQPAV